MPTIRDYYERVNAAWPKEIPPLTFEAGVNAVNRLYRFTTGRTPSWGYVETSGNRYNYPSRDGFAINTAGNGHGHGPANGWKDLVHDLSHYLVRRAFDYRIKPHSKEHARFELKLVKEVVKRGWLNPPTVLERVEAVAPEVAARVRDTGEIGRINAALKRWATKRKRADTAIRKLNRRKRYYERKVARS